MPLSPEMESRLKTIAMRGAVLALASLTLKNERIIEEKLLSSSVWEASQTVVVELIGNSKEKITKVAAILLRNARGDLVDVELDMEWMKGNIIRGEDGKIASAEFWQIEPVYDDGEIAIIEKSLSED